jgi:SAM-dependent methyltransferase
MTDDHVTWRTTVSRRYDAGVGAYDELWSPIIMPPAEELVTALAMADARRVLDVGCGAGALLPALRDAAPRAAIVGLDLSLGMLRLAHGRGFPVARSDAAALPIAARSFDVAVLAYMLFHLSEPASALRSTREALRPAGKVGTVTWAWERAASADALITAVLDDRGAPTPRSVADHGATDTIDKMRGLLAATGFEATRLWTVTIRHAFTPQSLLRLRAGTGVSRFRFDALSPATRRVVLADLGARLGSLPADDFEFSGELVLVTGTRV